MIIAIDVTRQKDTNLSKDTKIMCLRLKTNVLLPVIHFYLSSF